MSSEKRHITPPPALPKFLDTPESIKPDTQYLIGNWRRVQDRIVGSVNPSTATFDNVLLPLAHIENATSARAGMLTCYCDISPDVDLRQASEESQQLFESFKLMSATREDLFRLIDAVLMKNEKLDPESRRYLEKEHRKYVRNGIGLPPGAKKSRFTEIQSRLKLLEREFKRNMNNDSSNIWLTKDDLQGVSEDAWSNLEKGEGDNVGKFQIVLSAPDFYSISTDAKNDKTREELYLAKENSCVENRPLIREAVLLRDEAARILGYENHAALRLEDKMAKNPDLVNKFLDDLRHRLLADGHDNIRQLKQLKKADLEARGEKFDGHFFLWDYNFYHQTRVANQYSLDRKRLAEYFPLETTISRMLEIFETLFGLVFIRHLGGSENVWQDDVQIFRVWDDKEDGRKFLGFLYLDLFHRQGKYPMPSCLNVQPGFANEDGSRHYPATALLCSFAKPAPDKPSLVSRHFDIVLMFHELGHCIHDLVSKTRYSRFHGTVNVSVDFGEAPSQMLENWCLEPFHLKTLSEHYSYHSPEMFTLWESQSNGEPQPPRQIPDAIITALLQARRVTHGSGFHLPQLHKAIFDMKIHQPSSHEELENMDFAAEYNKLHREICLMDGQEVFGLGNDWGHGYASFNHIMNDYDAGYYAYLLSQVYSTDMFETGFKADTLNATEGQRYRRIVLEKGGSQDEMQYIVEFLGREPTTEAFHRSLGLS